MTRIHISVKLLLELESRNIKGKYFPHSVSVKSSNDLVPFPSLRREKLFTTLNRRQMGKLLSSNDKHFYKDGY